MPTEGGTFHSESCLCDSTQTSIDDNSMSRERQETLEFLGEEAASAVSMSAKALNDGGSRPEAGTAQLGQQHAQGEQPSGTEARVGEGRAVHQRELAAGSSALQLEPTCNVRGIATDHLLTEPLPQDLQECPTVDSASACTSCASGNQQERSCGSEWPIRGAAQEQKTERSNREGKHAGDATRQQQTQTDEISNLAVAVSMVCGLCAVLVCGLFMLASTYMSTNM